jgi:hypothetical protein
MIYKKTFKNSFDYDPRQKTFAVFSCNICGNEEDFDITGNRTFDFLRERLCPKCKCFGGSDYISNLNARIKVLTESKKKIDIEIELLIRQVAEKEHEIVK